MLTTKETPFFLVYGRDPMNPLDNHIRQWVNGQTRVAEYTQEVVNRLTAAKKAVGSAITKQKAKNKQHYDEEWKAPTGWET